MRCLNPLYACAALIACAPASLTSQTTPDLTGVILVSNQKAASASLIDLATGQVHNIPVGPGPHEAAISHDGRTGAISIYGIQPAGNQIAIIDLKTATVTKTIDLGMYRRPHGMAFLPGDQKLLATSEATSSVVMVDIAKGVVEIAISTNARGSHMLALPRSATSLFTANVGDGTISEIDLATRAFVKSYPIATQTEGIAISPDGSRVWVGSNNAATITVFDTGTRTVAATIPNAGMPYRLGITPDGRTVLAADPPGSRFNVIDAATFRIIGSIPLTGAPEGIAFSPDSRTAFITLNEANAVAVVDIAGRKEIRRFDVGTAPDGIAYTDVRRQAEKRTPLTP
jgi:YVTN family beta-propeller protein